MKLDYNKCELIKIIKCFHYMTDMIFMTVAVGIPENSVEDARRHHFGFYPIFLFFPLADKVTRLTTFTFSEM